MSYYIGLALLALSLGLIQADYHHHRCPDKNDWKEHDNICWRESRNKRNFKDAINYCLLDDGESFNGPYVDLMPVGKLRHLKNRFNPYYGEYPSSGYGYGEYDNHYDEEYHHYDEEYHHYDEEYHHHHSEYPHGYDYVHFDHKDGPFRVNAIKAHDGVWREYPTGRKVLLHHFPYFHPEEGHEGDTLVWDPEHNDLKVVDPHKEYDVLCYRAIPNYECKQCPGHEEDRACNDAGYCYHGKCKCDATFSGDLCEHTTTYRERYDLFVLGGGSDTEFDGDDQRRITEVFSFKHRTACNAEPLPEELDGGFAEIINKQIISCGAFTHNCYTYNWATQQWMLHSKMSEDHNYGNSEVVPVRMKDGYRSGSIELDTCRYYHNMHDNYLMWAAAGTSYEYTQEGEETTSDVTDNTEFLLPGKNQWIIGPDAPRGMDTTAFCLATIDDCHTAWVGGNIYTDGTEAGIETSTSTYTSRTFIFDWETMQYTEGPSLPTSPFAPSCGRIIDRSTGHPLVIIAGGYAYDETDDETDEIEHTYIWDTVTDTITRGPDLPFEMYVSEIVQMGNDEIILFGGYRDDDGASEHVLSFTLGNGWQDLGKTIYPHEEHAGVIVPAGSVKCKPQQFEAEGP